MQSIKSSLLKLIDELSYVTESEYPFELTDWGTKSLEDLRDIFNSLPTPSKAIVWQDFFEHHVRILKMNNDELSEKAAERYKQLQAFLYKNAESVTVWRSGKVRVAIYIVVTTSAGQVFVLRTTAVET
ncbi:MAG: nuclease A inhibitor family protein [Ferruginibacter sp.]